MMTFNALFKPMLFSYCGSYCFGIYIYTIEWKQLNFLDKKGHRCLKQSFISIWYTLKWKSIDFLGNWNGDASRKQKLKWWLGDKVKSFPKVFISMGKTWNILSKIWKNLQRRSHRADSLYHITRLKIWQNLGLSHCKLHHRIAYIISFTAPCAPN